MNCKLSDLEDEQNLVSQYFSKVKLLKTIYEKVVDKKNCAIGLDSISASSFVQNIRDEIQIIIRKVTKQEYHFSRYKMLLFPKGPNKNPRKICIPTIRDRIVIAIVSQILKEKFFKETQQNKANLVVSGLIKKRKKYTHYIKLDLSTFFASINHALLLEVIKTKISEQSILHLIQKILTTASYDPILRIEESPVEKKCGIPEGLSCSGLLADIFMFDIDQKYQNNESFEYGRFVDDIIIFCNEDNVERLRTQLINDLRNKKLIINEEKTCVGEIKNGFQYLGYLFKPNDVITVRESSIYKHEQRIDEMIKKYFKKMMANLKVIKDLQKKQDCGEKAKAKLTKYWHKLATLRYELEQKVSMLCSGSRTDDQFMGWLAYYRFINDRKLLHHLDWLVAKLYTKYDLGIYQGKRHVRAFYELTRNIKNTKYVEKRVRYNKQLQINEATFYNYAIQNCDDEEKKNLQDLLNLSFLETKLTPKNKINKVTLVSDRVRLQDEDLTKLELEVADLIQKKNLEDQLKNKLLKDSSKPKQDQNSSAQTDEQDSQNDTAKAQEDESGTDEEKQVETNIISVGSVSELPGLNDATTKSTHRLSFIGSPFIAGICAIPGKIFNNLNKDEKTASEKEQIQIDKIMDDRIRPQIRKRIGVAKTTTKEQLSEMELSPDEKQQLKDELDEYIKQAEQQRAQCADAAGGSADNGKKKISFLEEDSDDDYYEDDTNSDDLSGENSTIKQRLSQIELVDFDEYIKLKKEELDLSGLSDEEIKNILSSELLDDDLVIDDYNDFEYH